MFCSKKKNVEKKQTHIFSRFSKLFNFAAEIYTYCFLNIVFYIDRYFFKAELVFIFFTVNKYILIELEKLNFVGLRNHV